MSSVTVHPFPHAITYSQNMFLVFDPITGLIHSMFATEENAQKQIKYMKSVQNKSQKFKIKKCKAIV